MVDSETPTPSRRSSPPISSLSTALTLVLLATLGAACFGRSEVDGLGLRDRTVGEECRTDASCVEGLSCVQAVCVRLAPGPTSEPTTRPTPAPEDCPGFAGRLELDVRVSGSTQGKPNRYAATCGGGEAPEDLWVLELAAPTRVVLTTEGSAFDTLVYLRSACDDGPELACQDDLGAETVILELVAGTTLIFVDGFGEAGDYELLVRALE